MSGKAKPKVSGNDGLQSLEIFDAILRSTKTGKKIGKLMKNLNLVSLVVALDLGLVVYMVSRFDDKYEIVAGVFFSRNYKSINLFWHKYRNKKKWMLQKL